MFHTSECAEHKLGNSVKENNEVNLVEEEIELAVYRISTEALVKKQMSGEFYRFAVEALGQRKEIMVLPRCILEEVLKEVYDEPWTGGYFGLTKTLGKIRERYFLNNAEKEVKIMLDNVVQV
ncbi:hypothetical protein EVAR_66103_1 [Eumeta japonica]|uniref:Integrase zinc-binding domain-containing protein n=1 Tax=Eumeta variegata TaxID=151549 RepID=A0A4C1ZXD8_EUMVA|nr:hypothetical protein EVAR_66103_1 [Eumeta japonica]